MYKVTVPLRIPKNKRGDLWTLNLNSYRNEHHRVLHLTKKAYTELCLELIKEANIPPLHKVRMEVLWFPKTKRRSDVGNVCSIVSKYFDDALVESGLLPDDDYHHIPTYTHSFGSVDPENPRCEITIIPIEEEQ